MQLDVHHCIYVLQILLCSVSWISVLNHASVVMIEIIAKKEVSSVSLLFRFQANIFLTIHCKKKRYF